MPALSFAKTRWAMEKEVLELMLMVSAARIRSILITIQLGGH
jgi:hypothetical protein